MRRLRDSTTRTRQLSKACRLAPPADAPAMHAAGGYGQTAGGGHSALAAAARRGQSARVATAAVNVQRRG